MRQKKGVTLTELLILLGCIVFMSVVAITAYDRTLAPDVAAGDSTDDLAVLVASLGGGEG